MHFSVMDMDKLTGFDQITGKNGLFPPVLPISPALSFSVATRCPFEQLLTWNTSTYIPYIPIRAYFITKYK